MDDRPLPFAGPHAIRIDHGQRLQREGIVDPDADGERPIEQVQTDLIAAIRQAETE